MAVLVVVAVDAERQACAATRGVEIVVGGVGPAAGAAAAAAALAVGRYDLVLCAGIAGSFPPAEVGDVVVADAVVFADLGAETADGFVPVSTLGFGCERPPVDGETARRLARLLPARAGTILTVATVTGTTATARERHARYPGAIAEAMEGAGVATAAARAGVRFAELRAISNPVGPRDRAAWRVPDALRALGRAVNVIARADWTA